MTEVFTCPGCATPLVQMRLEHGIFWACPPCGGRALSVELLRRTFARESINPLWLRVLNGEGRTGRECPCCARPMLEVDLTDKPETPMVDVCRPCHFVWFDASEIGELAPLEIPVEPAAKRKPRALSSFPVNSLDDPPLNEWWQQLIRLLMQWID